MKRKIKAFFRFLISRMFLLNVLAAILVFCGIFYFLMEHLDDYTLQDESEHITVEWYYGMPAEDAVADIEKKGLRVEIDSVYIDGIEAGTVVKQFPLPTDSGGIKVKPGGRPISLKIQSYQPPGREVPQVIEKSRRLAEEKLKSREFEVTVQYKPHESTYVLDLLVDGKSVEKDKTGKVKPGIKCPKGTKVTLIVGKGKARPVAVPVLDGMTISEASKRLSSASLVLYIAGCEGCDTGADSTAAVVVKQSPYGGEGSAAAAGSEVTIWLSAGSKEEADSLGVGGVD